jgi:hypothetical protein
MASTQQNSGRLMTQTKKPEPHDPSRSGLGVDPSDTYSGGNRQVFPMQERFKDAKEVTNPNSPWRKHSRFRGLAPDEEVKAAHQHSAEPKREAEAFDRRCERMKAEALEFRKTIRYLPRVVHPSRMTDAVLAC